MRNKKLLSTVVATAMIATMAMPVMAADGGQVDVDVDTKTGVLRVEVPTSMAVAVDQFEIANAGSQIYSGEFPMTNKSEIAVKVDVTSTVTTGTGITLAASKNGLTGDQAWLAAAAMTGTGSYDIATTADKTENAWDLSEANDNVATFSTTDKKAKQTFYLEKADPDSAVVYKLAIPDGNGKVGESYAKFYELTDVSITADGSTETDQLQTAVNASDVYVVVNDTTSDPADPEADGKVMTKLAKGTDLSAESPAVTWAATKKYYKMVDDTADTVAAGNKYVYAAKGTAGANGAAGFTYIGKLSDGRATWTDSDISAIKIEYTITGVTASNYTEAAKTCTYGLYKDPTPTVAGITSGATAVTAGSADAQEGVTHTTTLAQGTDTKIVLALPAGISVKKVYPGGQLSYFDGSPAENPANASVDTDGKTIVVHGDGPWATGGQATKYIKIIVGASANSDSDTSFIVKVAVN